MLRSKLRFLFHMVGLLVSAVVALALVGVILLFVLPRLFNWEIQVVLSGSMEPALPVGSVILVRPVDPQAVSVGDIVTYRPQGATDFVTHRVVEVNREGSDLSFRTQGDANKAPDPAAVAPDAVEGRVWTSIPYLGYAARYARNLWGLLFLVGVPGALIISGELWNIVKAVRRERRNRAQVKQQEAPESSPQPVGDVLSAVRWRAPRPVHRVKRAATGQRLIVLVLLLLIVTVGAFIIGGELRSIAGPARRGRRRRAQARRQEGRG